MKNCDLFERLTPEQISRLESRSKSKTFQRSNLLYLPNDCSDAVLLLISGRVKIYHITGEGKQALLAIVDPGEVFGELTVLDSGQREEFSEAMETSKVVLIPGSEIRELMEENTNVSVGVTKLMGLRRRKVERRLKSLLFRSNRDRLVHLLLELADKLDENKSAQIKDHLADCESCRKFIENMMKGFQSQPPDAGAARDADKRFVKSVASREGSLIPVLLVTGS